MNDELEPIYVRRCRECGVRRPLGWFRAGRICVMCLPEGVRGAPSRVLTLTDEGRKTANGR